MRSAIDEKLIGYCVEPPKKVLEVAFHNYHITRYKGHELFSSGDFESTTPMVGLAISAVNPVLGIKGKISDILKLDILKETRREKKISKKDIKKILNNIQEESLEAWTSPDYKQRKHIVGEITKILKGYCKKRV